MSSHRTVAALLSVASTSLTAPGQVSRPGSAPASRPAAADTETAIRSGLRWLARHQDADGAWDPAGFMRHDPGTPKCDGAGNAAQKVGVTGLALLALLGNAQATPMSPHEPVTWRAIDWLVKQQDLKGRIGGEATRDAVYGHGIATLALAEALAANRRPELVQAVQKAVESIQESRNPFKVWRYTARDGDNDTSVTGWMVLALVAAKRAGCTVDRSALEYTKAWFDEVTDPRTGQCGYRKRGEASSREDVERERFPAHSSEALTALALLCRLELGQDPATNPVLMAAAASIANKPPAWSADAASADAYYWSFATQALRRAGAPQLPAWCEALDATLARRQRTDGPFAGSFDPAGPWSAQGGRVYQTALLVLCLQARAGTLRILAGR